MLNPAHLLVGTKSKNETEANAFVDWMIRHDGGQQVIKTFERNGAVLYTEAPQNINPLWKAKSVVDTTEPVKITLNPLSAGKETESLSN